MSVGTALVEKAASAWGTVIGTVGAGILVVEVEVAGDELDDWLDWVAGAVWLAGSVWATDWAETTPGLPNMEQLKESAPNQTADFLLEIRRHAKDIPVDCLIR
jgi:hypothetical protein